MSTNVFAQYNGREAQYNEERNGYNEEDAERNFEQENGPESEQDVTADRYNTLRSRALYYFKTKERLHHELSESRQKVNELKEENTEAADKTKEEAVGAGDDYYATEKETQTTIAHIAETKKPETEYQKQARLKREAAIVKVRCKMDKNDCNKTYKEL
jgi:hypothetical protein